MKTAIKYLLLITFAGYLYVCLELIFRGHSDISMMFCASVCVIPMIALNNIYTYDMDFELQVLVCMIFSTGVEWITGIIVNQDYHIWDYRNLLLHSPDGQICVPFMLLWGLISGIVIPLMDYIDWKVFDYMPDTPPYYIVCGKQFQMK